MGDTVTGLDEPDVAELVTSGRVSGNPHAIEIWFAMGEEHVYLLAGGGERSDWVRNLMVSPEVVLEIAGRKRQTRARVVDAGTEEDSMARRLLVDKYVSRGHEDLTEWGRSALVVEVAWPS